MVFSKEMLLVSSNSSSVQRSWHKSRFKGAKGAVLVKAEATAAATAPVLRDHHVASIDFKLEAKRKISTDLHAPPKQRLEVIDSMADWAQTNLLSLLKPVEKCWQPQDYLPVSSSPTFADEVFELQKRMSNIPDDHIVCLVGDMITEEALPTYQTMFNTFEGVRDVSGCSNTPWAVWIRAWTAEENRHGELLNKYLYLSGRVNMKMVERTIQSLIGSGMEPHIDNDPYNGFIYTSFQERATFISHGNTARHAKEYGDSKLAVICGLIAADEKRHELAYTKVMGRIFEIDPSGAMLALEHMMRKKITMPAHLMYDGTNSSLFSDYAAIAQNCNVYTSKDYTDIMEHLIKVWNVEQLVGLSSEAQRAQEYVCNLVQRFRKLEDRCARQARPRTGRDISWILKPAKNL